MIVQSLGAQKYRSSWQLRWEVEYVPMCLGRIDTALVWLNALFRRLASADEHGGELNGVVDCFCRHRSGEHSRLQSHAPGPPPLQHIRVHHWKEEHLLISSLSPRIGTFPNDRM